jgi:hypothetical protein
LVAKIAPPVSAANSIHANTSRRSSSATPAPRCGSYSRNIGSVATASAPTAEQQIVIGGRE